MARSAVPVAERSAKRRNEWGDHETWHNLFRPLGADSAIFKNITIVSNIQSCSSKLFNK